LLVENWQKTRTRLHEARRENQPAYGTHTSDARFYQGHSHTRRKSFEKKVLFLVIGRNTSAFCVYASLLAYGRVWRKMSERKSEKRKTKRQNKVVSLSLPKCLQFGMEASWAKKGMKSNKHESREARLVPKATTIVKQLFFFSLGFRRKQLGSACVCGRDKLCSG